MKFPLSLVGAAALPCLVSGAVCAQSSSAPVTELGSVIVTGNPLGSDEVIAPVDVLTGQALERRRARTLGETLDGLPGVASSGFGPNASRPVIRGMDGDRVRILDNSGGMADVSSLSDDHAVAIDPMSIERVEVLRGPGALLYGGSALGGVVNIIDNRISPQALFDAKGGVSAALDASNGSGPHGHALSGRIETGTDRYTLHLDGFDRRHADLRAREALCKDDTDTLVPSRRICNSAAQATGGGAGLTLHFDRGHVGIAHSRLHMDYGTVAEPGVTIGLHSDKTRLAGEWKLGTAVLDKLRWQWGHSRYRHTEFEGAEPATTFAQTARDGRIELHHQPLAGWRGLIGLQWDRSQFSADGEEAYAPYSRTRRQAVFVHEERPTDWGRLQWALRWEDVRVASLGHPDLERLNTAVGERRFAPVSAGASALVRLGQGWSATGQWGLTQRAPRDSELYANGPHAATHAYEVGNPHLGVETARHLEAGLQWASGAHQLRLSAYTSKSHHHIFLQETGATEDDLPVYAYVATTARFRGLEFSGTHPLALPAPGKWFVDWKADVVRADNLGTGEPMPRIAPARFGAALRVERGALSGQLGLEHSLAQRRVPTGQTGTAAYTLWNFRSEYQLQRGAHGQLWAYLRADNLTDAKAFNASSVLTQTAPGQSPLPGRTLTVGLRYAF